MPQGGKLTAAEKQLIKSYIQYGRFPQATAETEAALRAKEAARITDKDRNWWSFRKPVKPAVPAVSEQRSGPHADRRLRPGATGAQGLEDAARGRPPDAHPPRLLRPDRPAADSGRSAGVRGRQVARTPGRKSSTACWPRRITASSGAGTGWMWPAIPIPAAMPGDSDREVSWKYRDYVINAFNRNKPINQFIVEQLAGDQLVNYKHLAIPTPDQIEPLTATGFMRTTADITDNQTIYEVDKYFDAQQKAMETSLTALLGVTVQCARCHDHKFDPFLQRDYYKLMAVYQPVWDPENWLPADLNHGPWPSRMVLDMDAGRARGVDQGRHQQRCQGDPPHGRSAGSDLSAIPRRAEGRPRHLGRSEARCRCARISRTIPTWKSTATLPRTSSPTRRWRSASRNWRSGKTRSR